MNQQHFIISRQVGQRGGDGTRYIPIPQQEKQEGYRDMERFIATVQDHHLQDQLWVAVQGQGAFRRFKDVLLAYPAERDRCVHERILSWLEAKGIEPTNPIEPPLIPEPETPASPSDETRVEDLTLLLIYLTLWTEHPVSDMTVRRAWKGYLFEVLDALEEKGLIEQSRHAKSLYLTEDGIRRAQELEQEYGER